MHRADEHNLNRIEKQFSGRFEKNSDFTCKHIFIGEEEFKAYFLDTLVNFPTTLSKINQIPTGEGNNSFLEDPLLAVDRLSNDLLHGKMVLFNKTGCAAVIEPEQSDISRPITTPESENPLQSAFDAFTEDLNSNIGLLRKKLISNQLVIESRNTGTRSTKKIALIYLEGAAQASVVQSIRDKLDQNKDKDIVAVGDLLNLLELPKFSITPTYTSSELPGESAQNLMNGKVIILIDQFSFAFTFPAIITDLWSAPLDGNYPYLFQLFLRAIRISGAILAITLPALYVVLNSVNPELLRIQLAITVAKSREGVPYP